MDIKPASEPEAQPPGSKTPNGKPNSIKKPIGTWLKGLISKDQETNLRADLEEIIQEHEEEGNATTVENTILRNVLKFDELRVTDVMTPRLDICAVSAEISLDELKKYIDENEHTRIPIFDKNLDDVVGFIHIKDLIGYWLEGTKKFQIQQILREVLFVPPTMKINSLLIKMQNERTHMAIVVDEYGGTAGLVTIEDLVEQIVGEIEDEHDEESEEEFIKTGENTYEALARLSIPKLEENLGIKIYAENEDSDYETLGGLIYSKLGKIPRIGESFDYSQALTFKVVDADKRRIKRVKIINKPINI